MRPQINSEEASNKHVQVALAGRSACAERVLWPSSASRLFTDESAAPQNEDGFACRSESIRHLNEQAARSLQPF